MHTFIHTQIHLYTHKRRNLSKSHLTSWSNDASRTYWPTVAWHKHQKKQESHSVCKCNFPENDWATVYILLGFQTHDKKRPLGLCLVYNAALLMPRCVSSVRFIHCSRAGRGQGLIKQLHLTLLNNAQLLLITQQANWQQNESSSN